MPPGRRNVRKLTFRPPSPRRAIVWFPGFPADSPIEAVRRRHDPHAAALPAHVTLVFPFPTSFTVVQLASHVRRIVGNWPGLPVSFRDVEGILDEYVVLMVRERADAVTALHDKLYRGILKPHLRDDIPYSPHVTLGRVAGNPSGSAYAEMCAEAEAALHGRAREWRAVLRELAIVTHEPDGTIVLDRTIPLNFA